LTGIELSCKLSALANRKHRILAKILKFTKEKKMVNKKICLGLLVLVLVFGMMLVGCDDGSGNDDGNSGLPSASGVNAVGARKIVCNRITAE
jgi:hypothetical protein